MLVGSEWFTMHHMTTQTEQKIRLTIPVTPEVHQVFKRISEALGHPVGRTMGDWLEDTLDAALFTHNKIVEARTAPKLVAQELRALALGASDMADNLIEDLRRAGSDARRAGVSGAAGGASEHPPSCNTGGKVHKKGTK